MENNYYDKYLKYKNKYINKKKQSGGFMLCNIKETKYLLSQILEIFKDDTEFPFDYNLNSEFINNNKLVDNTLTALYKKLVDIFMITKKYKQKFIRKGDIDPFYESSDMLNTNINYAALIFISLLVEYELFAFTYNRSLDSYGNIIKQNISINYDNEPIQNQLIAVYEGKKVKYRYYKSYGFTNLYKKRIIENNVGLITLFNQCNIQKKQSSIIRYTCKELDQYFMEKIEIFFNDLISHINKIIIYLIDTYGLNENLEFQKLIYTYDTMHNIVSPTEDEKYDEKNPYEYIYYDWKDRIIDSFQENVQFFSKNSTQALSIYNNYLMIDFINRYILDFISNLEDDNAYISESDGFFSFVHFYNPKKPHMANAGSCLTSTMIEIYFMTRLHINPTSLSLKLSWDNTQDGLRHPYWIITQNTLEKSG